MMTNAPAPPVLAQHAARNGIGQPELLYTLLPDRLVVEGERLPPVFLQGFDVPQTKLRKVAATPEGLFEGLLRRRTVSAACRPASAA